MILVLFEVNGKTHVLERASLSDAKKDMKSLIEETKRHYPHKQFTPRYFQAEEI